MAITAKQLNPHGYPTDGEVAANLAILLDRMNEVRSAYGKPMVVNSGLRSQADQTRINPGAPKSKHLIGAACDISDPDGSLAAWVKANLPKMKEIGLWMEEFSKTQGWVHFQCIPPKSGNRIFIP